MTIFVIPSPPCPGGREGVVIVLEKWFDQVSRHLISFPVEKIVWVKKFLNAISDNLQRKFFGCYEFET